MVLDNFGQGRSQPHHQLLQQTLAAYPDEFVRVGSYPVTVGQRQLTDAIVVYRNALAYARPAGILRLEPQKRFATGKP